MAERGVPAVDGMRNGRPYGVKGERLVTMTFAEAGENEAGMELIGATGGEEVALTVPELEALCARFKAEGRDARVFRFDQLANQGPDGEVCPTLPHAAFLLVKGVVAQDVCDRIEEDLWAMPIDTMALFGMGKRRAVMNKHGRHNNVLTDRGTRPPAIASKDDYADGKGSVVDIDAYPEIVAVRDWVQEVTGRSLPVAENNYYYEISKRTGIGWHGDRERRITVYARFGRASPRMPLRIQWFYNRQPYGPVFEFVVDQGDLLFMSKKANGKDWMDTTASGTFKRWTMRHATGAKLSEPKDPERAGHIWRLTESAHAPPAGGGGGRGGTGKRKAGQATLAGWAKAPRPAMEHVD